jgi:hypothetical protein
MLHRDLLNFFMLHTHARHANDNAAAAAAPTTKRRPPPLERGPAASNYANAKHFAHPRIAFKARLSAPRGSVVISPESAE